MGRKLGIEPLLAEATDMVNERRMGQLAQLIQYHLGDREAVGILGLAYKPGTGVAEESAGSGLARLLAQAGYEVYVYDPVVAAEALSSSDERIHGCASVEDVFRRCSVTVIATPWPEFAELLPDALAMSSAGGAVVIDCWRVIQEGDYDGAATIIRPGRQSRSRSTSGVS
jgi:UDPglucose 6-dehydrogenase